MMARIAGVNLPIITAKGPNLSAAEVALSISAVLFERKLMKEPSHQNTYRLKTPKIPKVCPDHCYGCNQIKSKNLLIE